MNETNNIPKKKLRLLEYHRVSTYKQKHDVTIETQKNEIKKFLNRSDKKFEVVDIYEDEAKSGFKFSEDERPEYNKMLDQLRSDPNIDGVLAYDLDRFGRDSFELIGFGRNMVLLQKEIILVKDKIDQSTPFGEFYFELKALLSQLTGKNIIHQLKAGRQRKKEENIKHGLPKTYGFGRKKKIIPKEIKEKMIKWYNKGYGFKEIQNRMQTVPYPYYNEIENIYETKTGYKLSTSTIGDKLREWNVEIREPKYSKSKELIKKRIEREVGQKVEVMKQELLKNLKDKEGSERRWKTKN